MCYLEKSKARTFFHDKIVKAANHSALYYWTSEGAAEVDFVIEKDSDVYPVEVKAGGSRHKKR